jgi:hypothetical protein
MTGSAEFIDIRPGNEYRHFAFLLSIALMINSSGPGGQNRNAVVSGISVQKGM